MLGGDSPLLSQTTSPDIKTPTRLRRKFSPVRWKLLIITSLAAALLSAGGMYVLTYLSETYPAAPNALPPLSPSLVVISLAVTTLASVFVYRHTARRRKLQATLTALLSLVLTVAAVFAVARIVFGRAAGVARSRTAAPAQHRGVS
jgi:phosphoglycerol transferase MdoB-like AlkP superfamily enzyme